MDTLTTKRNELEQALAARDALYSEMRTLEQQRIGNTTDPRYIETIEQLSVVHTKWTEASNTAMSLQNEVIEFEKQAQEREYAERARTRNEALQKAKSTFEKASTAHNNLVKHRNAIEQRLNGLIEQKEALTKECEVREQEYVESVKQSALEGKPTAKNNELKKLDAKSVEVDREIEATRAALGLLDSDLAALSQPLVAAEFEVLRCEHFNAVARYKHLLGVFQKAESDLANEMPELNDEQDRVTRRASAIGRSKSELLNLNSFVPPIFQGSANVALKRDYQMPCGKR